MFVPLRYLTVRGSKAPSFEGASTVCPYLWNFLLIFCSKVFERGAGENFFQKVFPCILLLTYSSSSASSAKTSASV